MKKSVVCVLMLCLAFIGACARAEGKDGFWEPIEGIMFPKGETYPVYYGPGDSYDRMAGGKAAVSTNDWIQVYGAERDAVLLEYKISEGRHRFGWVSMYDLPDSVSVWQRMPWQWGYAHIGKETFITDDPLHSRNAIATLTAGTKVCILYESDEWAYVDVPPMRGFVPLATLTPDEVPYQDDPNLVRVVEYFETTGISGHVSGLYHGPYGKELYFTLDKGGTAEYDVVGDEFYLYDMNWRFDGICDEDLALFLNHYLGLLVDVQSGRSPEEHLRVGYHGDLGQRNIDAVVSTGLMRLESQGKQWLDVLLKQLSAHVGKDSLNSLRARAASRMLGKLDNTPVDPTEGCAWYDALTLSKQDALPPIDAAIYEENPTYQQVTQALIAYMEAERASRGGRRDVDSTKTRVIVVLDVQQVRETDGELTLWASVSESEYALYDGKRYQSVSGSWIPSRITMGKDKHGKWVLDELLQADDGTMYAPSIVDFCDGDKELASRLMKGERQRSPDACFHMYLDYNGYGEVSAIPY